MGLSLHYQVHLADCDRTKAGELVQKLHRHAEEFVRAKAIDQVLPISSDHEDLERFALRWLSLPDPDDPHTIHGVEVKAIDGWIFPVILGDGCEPLWLGLCRYPAFVHHGGRELPTTAGDGWCFQSACKTQYASQHGWEHFHRCHTSAILLIDTWTEFGAKLHILDEGEWWPQRSDATLRRKLDEMNGLVAAFAGAMKDAADEGGPAVASPIFADPNFERLEAAGVARHGAKLEAAKKIVADAARDGAAGPASI